MRMYTVYGSILYTYAIYVLSAVVNNYEAWVELKSNYQIYVSKFANKYQIGFWLKLENWKKHLTI